jgi:sensor domain CHASE-containing protein
MFFDWGAVAVIYTFKQLFICTLLILVILSLLFYGILQIIRDNGGLRQDNERLKKKVEQLTEELLRGRRKSHF